MIRAPPASHSSGENSRRSNHRKPLLLRSPKPSNKTGSRTVRAYERRRPAPRLQSYGTCPILDNRRHPQFLQQSAGDVRGEHSPLVARLRASYEHETRAKEISKETLHDARTRRRHANNEPSDRHGRDSQEDNLDRQKKHRTPVVCISAHV